MLGKTNITTLLEGAIVTEIEDYNWIQVQSGVFADFVAAIFKNGYLVAITADGTVVYTTDGEAWQTYMLEYENCRLNDIDWDGNDFVLAGGYINNGKKTGLILRTANFEEYVELNTENSSDSETNYDTEYHAIYPSNGKYLVIAERIEKTYRYVYAYVGDLVNAWDRMNRLHAKNETNGVAYYVESVTIAKNSSEMLLHINYYAQINTTTTWYNEIQKIDNKGTFTHLHNIKSGNIPVMNVYECKDALFYSSMMSTDDYKIVKVLPSNETNILSTGQNFFFKDGVYFNECQLFINSHEMLIVKKRESISDKTLDDLIEIAPELTMNCITKAFGQLYIFGNQGVILKSSVETNNEEAIIVQTISAKKALQDAKKYTDEQYAALEARIVALEKGGSGNNG